MFLRTPSGGLRRPTRFPRGGGPLFGGPVGHQGQGFDNFEQILFRHHPEGFAAADFYPDPESADPESFFPKIFRKAFERSEIADTKLALAEANHLIGNFKDP